jgi:hypothetical protein
MGNNPSQPKECEECIRREILMYKIWPNEKELNEIIQEERNHYAIENAKLRNELAEYKRREDKGRELIKMIKEINIH